MTESPPLPPPPPRAMREAEKRKRPEVLTAIVILWFIGGVYNLIVSSGGILTDFNALPLLSRPEAPEWLKIGLPVELALLILVFVIGLLQMYTIYGLWTGKSWSYKVALAIPILVAVSWILQTGLYLSAPVELGLRENISWASLISSLFFVALYWELLRTQEVKEYLGVDGPTVGATRA